LLHPTPPPPSVVSPLHFFSLVVFRLPFCSWLCKPHPHSSLMNLIFILCDSDLSATLTRGRPPPTFAWVGKRGNSFKVPRLFFSLTPSNSLRCVSPAEKLAETNRYVKSFQGTPPFPLPDLRLQLLVLLSPPMLIRPRVHLWIGRSPHYTRPPPPPFPLISTVLPPSPVTFFQWLPSGIVAYFFPVEFSPQRFFFVVFSLFPSCHCTP